MDINRDIIFVMILVVVLGLYATRYFFRLAYAFVEIWIGLFAIAFTMRRAPEFADPQILVQLAAGIYIIIRGIDNFVQAELMKRVHALDRRRRQR
jgi:hypothetical protein